MDEKEKSLVHVNGVYEYFVDFFGARQGGPTSTGGKKKDKQLSHDRALKRVTERIRLGGSLKKLKEWNLEEQTGELAKKLFKLVRKQSSL